MVDLLNSSVFFSFLTLAFIQVASLAFLNPQSWPLKIILLSFLGVIFLETLENYLLVSGEILSLPFFIRAPDALHTLVGILPFVYIKTYVENRSKIKPSLLIHLAVPLLSFVILIPTYLEDSVSKIDKYYLGFVDRDIRYLALAQVLVVLIYCFFSLRLIHSYSLEARHYISNLVSLKLEWLKQMVVAIVIFFSCFTLLLAYDFEDLYPSDYSLLANLGLFLLLITLTLVTIGSAKPFMSLSELRKLNSPTNKKSSLSEESIQEYAHRIQESMADKQLFLNPELKLSDLSRSSSIPEYLISQILREHFHKNFNEFINGYRIQEVIRRMKDPQYSHMTLLALANDSGFNSKSTFNTQFKTETGVTPRQFRSTL